jgi:hypothetical protein
MTKLSLAGKNLITLGQEEFWFVTFRLGMGNCYPFLQCNPTQAKPRPLVEYEKVFLLYHKMNKCLFYKENFPHIWV